MLAPLISNKMISGLSHITGGGITENLPRSLTDNIEAEIDLDKWNVPKIFKWIQSYGVTQSEMLRTFNCGYGMVVILDKSNLNKFENLMKRHKLGYDKIGILLNSKKSKKRIKFIGKLNFDD